ncbi:hypothetical protein [Methylobacterium durans]|uniref:Uncharacterized protein n=1 Tax=Methylobacterium durans TaxID=2202825 RepID=A0A2U8WEF6_9HYPH|nr:hypothetical protein [Methylobacterium durans]AWN43931.1 hypothetical protein DK389_29740 [Methylobacterium durans]
MTQRDPIPSMGAGPISEPAPGAALPFLPTLVTALAIAALSLVCREPSQTAPTPERAQVSSAQISAAASAVEPAFVPVIDDFAFHPPAEAAETVRPPAALAFAQVYCLVPAEPRLAAATRPGRVAAAPRRAPCSACGEAGPRRSEAPPASRAAETPAVEPETQEDAFLPRLALPFAPAMRVVDRAVDRAAGYVRTGASALGGSVSVLVDRLR